MVVNPMAYWFRKQSPNGENGNLSVSAPPPPSGPPIQGETLVHDTEVRYFDVEGNTPQELQNSILQHQINTGMQAEARWGWDWQPGSLSDGKCGVTTGQIIARVSVLLPRWNAGPNATESTKRWWSDYIRGLADHEQGHVDLARTGAVTATQSIHDENCTSFHNKINLWYLQLNNQQTEYDRTHGSRG